MKLTVTIMDGGTIPRDIIAWKELEVASVEQAVFDIRELVRDVMEEATKDLKRGRKWTQMVMTLERQ